LWYKIATDDNRFDELMVGVCYKRPSAKGSEVNKLFQVIEKAAASKVMVLGGSTSLVLTGTHMTVIEMGKILEI
jgi:putative NADH-flavin reductase